MSDNTEPSVERSEIATPPSHDRILVIMAIMGVAGGIAGAVLESIGFGLGILLGTALAFVNYYWLKRSLRKIFEVVEHGERPRMLGTKYFLRYVVLAIVVAIVYITGLVPIIALVLGLAGFGFAVMIEGFIRIVTGLMSEPSA